MDWVSTLALALGASWVSGLRLYGCAATLGWLGKLGYVQLPGNLTVLTHDWVVWTATALFVIEFIADKIPYFDTGWDAVHTFIRIPAGAILATAAFAHYDPKIQTIAFLIGGGLAASSHVTKASARAVVNASPEPVSNWFFSLAEDCIAGLQTVLALALPVIAIFSVVAAVAISLYLLPKALGAAKRAISGKRASADPTSS